MQTRILGIDPGSLITGFGIIDSSGNHSKPVNHGIIQTKSSELPVKLHTIYNELDKIIDHYQPDEVAIEKIFMHRNADSALKLGQARGAAITICVNRQLKIFEYTANQVKQATVGKGHAAKKQVQHMIKVLLCLDKIPQEDAADALAVALCHAHTHGSVKRIAGIKGISRGRYK